MDLFSTGLDENQNYCPKTEPSLLWVYDATSRCQFYLKIYWKPLLEKRWGCHFGKLIITKERSPGMGYYLAIPILKELSKP
jgi:hypothetical protein